MNIVVLTESDFAGSSAAARARVDGRRAEHLREILRVEVGSTVEVGVLGDRLGKATVIEVTSAHVDLAVELDRDPPPRFPLTLVLALPRPKSLRRILQACAAFGVEAIYLVNANRVEKSYWRSPVLAPEKMRGELMLGLEQAGDTRMPRVHRCQRFRPFVEDALPEIAASTRRLVGDPHSPVPCPSEVGEAVTLVIGPEGGLIPYEIESLVQCGFEAVHLGPRTLRVEHAVSAFLGRLAAYPSGVV